MVMACLQHPSHYKSSGGKMRERSGAERLPELVCVWQRGPRSAFDTHPPLHMIKELEKAEKKNILAFEINQTLQISTRERFLFTFALLATVKGGEVGPSSDAGLPQQITAQQVCGEACEGSCGAEVFFLWLMNTKVPTCEGAQNQAPGDELKKHECSFTFMSIWFPFISLLLPLLKQ